jgi:hypothetical protein
MKEILDQMEEDIAAIRNLQRNFDTFDGAKPRFLNRGKKRRSVSTLSIPRASDRGVEWVDFHSKKLEKLMLHLQNYHLEKDQSDDSEFQQLDTKNE